MKGYTLRSGRRILGTIKATETRDVYLWSSNFTKDRGVTTGLDRAIRIVLNEARMSPRQYEIDLVDVETAKRRRLGGSAGDSRAVRDPRLTPDITFRGRMPTALEYKTHLRLLEDADHDERMHGRSEARVFRNWLGKDMSALEHDVWIAVHRHGLLKQNRDGYHRLTPYGRVYLEQRRGSSRDGQRSRRRS